MKFFDYNFSYEVNKVKYKLFAKKLHPDCGGTADQFNELKNEWEFYQNTYKNYQKKENKTTNKFSIFYSENLTDEQTEYIDTWQELLNRVILKKRNSNKDKKVTDLVFTIVKKMF